MKYYAYKKHKKKLVPIEDKETNINAQKRKSFANFFVGGSEEAIDFIRFF